MKIHHHLIRRVLTALTRVAGLLVVVIVAGLTTSASAQEAEMQAFAPTSGVVVIVGNNLDLSGNIIQIHDRLNMFIAPFSAASLFKLAGMADNASINNGMLVFGTAQRPLQVGDTLRIFNFLSSSSFDITTRVYTDSSGNLSGAISTSLAINVTGNEFFIDSVTFATTQVRAATNIGYDLMTCGGALVPAVDGLMCISIPVCIGDQTLNAQMNMCDNPTCIGDQTVVNGVCRNPTCVGDQTIAEGTCRNPTCVDGQTVVSGVCVAVVIPPTTNPTPPTTTPSSLPTITPGGGSGTGGAIVGGGVLILVAANYIVAAYSGGAVGEFNFSPDYGYSITESGYSYNYGGRVEYQNASWNLYWTATQANANGNTGDLRYGSGGSYKADFWTATFAESISGETADYDFAFSADVESGIWKLSPVYRMHSHFEEDGQSETNNALNLEGSLRYNRWTISPSAGFRWENAEDFGDKARFGLSVVRQL